MQFTVDKCESKRQQLTSEKPAMTEESKSEMIPLDRPRSDYDDERWGPI